MNMFIRQVTTPAMMHEQQGVDGLPQYAPVGVKSPVHKRTRQCSLTDSQALLTAINLLRFDSVHHEMLKDERLNKERLHQEIGSSAGMQKRHMTFNDGNLAAVI